MRSPVTACALRALSLCCRVLAWALVALVVADALLPAGPRSLFLPLNSIASHLVPESLLGLFVFPTPFGGAFRGDFALFSLALLALDWVLARASSHLARPAWGESHV